MCRNIKMGVAIIIYGYLQTVDYSTVVISNVESM